MRLDSSGAPVPGRQLDLREPLGDELARARIVGVGLELDRDLRRRPSSMPTGRAARPAGPASAVSIGIATRVSSSSAPIAGFCTITLKTGADEIGEHVARQLAQRHRPERRRRRARARSRRAACRSTQTDEALRSRRPPSARGWPPPPLALSASALSRNAPSTTTSSPARQTARDLDLAAEVATAADRSRTSNTPSRAE